jgi:hypothetical protein
VPAHESKLETAQRRERPLARGGVAQVVCDRQSLPASVHTPHDSAEGRTLVGRSERPGGPDTGRSLRQLRLRFMSAMPRLATCGWHLCISHDPRLSALGSLLVKP